LKMIIRYITYFSIKLNIRGFAPIPIAIGTHLLFCLDAKK